MAELMAGGAKWWKISLGRQGWLWDRCSEEGIIIVGNWGVKGLGDLREYSAFESLRRAVRSHSAARQLWDFFKGVRLGDRVVAYGKSMLQGLGVVIGEYDYQDYDNDFEEEVHIRRVQWQAFDPPISIHRDPTLWGRTAARGPFTLNATLVPLDQSHVDRLNDLFRENGIDVPGTSSTVPVTSAIHETEGLSTANAQGFSSSPQVRRAVEEYSMMRATSYFLEHGYNVTPVGKPFDLECRRAQEILYVEVKGTQTAGTQVILTRNEVEFARDPVHTMALFVVSGVVLSGAESAPSVTGGRIRVINPWKIENDRLSAIAYEYALPSEPG